MKRPVRSRRKGAIAPLTALLLIPLMAMLAFSIDVGWITHTHNELQAAADAAALAGAGQLGDGFVSYYLPGVSSSQKTTILNNAKTQATTAAQAYAGYNGAGDVSSLTLLSSDIEFGYTDSSGNYTALPTYTGYPNTVKVTLRRDSSANGALPTFFARILGISTVDLNATATASIMGGQVNGFQSSTINSRILPMTYDVNHWNNFLKTGQSPDGGTSTAPNGLPQLSVYPSIKYTGNFGLLSLDQSNDGASTISSWINNGVPWSDLQAEYTKGLLPLSQHSSLLPPDWKGNSGLKDSDIKAVGDNINQLYLLPLFKPVSDGSLLPYLAGTGSGSNYYYTIVEFVGVKITAVDSTGSDKAIYVQPTCMIDPNALYDSVSVAQAPSGSSTLTTTFVGARLTN